MSRRRNPKLQPMDLVIYGALGLGGYIIFTKLMANLNSPEAQRNRIANRIADTASRAGTGDQIAQSVVNQNIALGINPYTGSPGSPGLQGWQ